MNLIEEIDERLKPRHGWLPDHDQIGIEFRKEWPAIRAVLVSAQKVNSCPVDIEELRARNAELRKALEDLDEA